VLNSAFPVEEVERERGVVLQEIARYDDEPESVTYHAASEFFWPEQGLGRPIPRPAEVIRTISRETIIAYMADNYRASRMVLSVSGNIDEAAVLAEDGGQFGGVAEISDLYQEKAVFRGGEKRIE
jgi:predicted Zn-dependent peptidase